MLLINCEIKLSLTWIENCILATSVNIANDAIANAVQSTFKIKKQKNWCSIVTLSAGDNVKLTKQWRERSKDLFIGTNIK